MIICYLTYINLLGKVPLVCGGKFGTGKCYTYNSAGNTWEAKGSITYKVGFAGYSFHKTLGLIMSGGQYRDTKNKDQYSDLLESTPDGLNFRKPIKLPYKTGYHCQVLLDDDTLMIMGNGNRAYVINLTTGEITHLPKMPGRAIHTGCGLAKKSSGERFVVVAGVDAYEQGTYIFDLRRNQWSKGAGNKSHHITMLLKSILYNLREEPSPQNRQQSRQRPV